MLITETETVYLGEGQMAIEIILTTVSSIVVSLYLIN